MMVQIIYSNHAKSLYVIVGLKNFFSEYFRPDQLAPDIINMIVALKIFDKYL